MKLISRGDADTEDDQKIFNPLNFYPFLVKIVVSKKVALYYEIKNLFFLNLLFWVQCD